MLIPSPTTMSLNSHLLEQNCQHALKTCDFLGVINWWQCSHFPIPGLALYDAKRSNKCHNFIHSGAGLTPNVCASFVSIIMSCSSSDPALFPSSTIYISGPQATSLAGCMCYDANKLLSICLFSISCQATCDAVMKGVKST